MSVLVYTELDNGTFKKTALEAVSYGKGIADAMGTTVTAISLGSGNADALGAYGAAKVLEASGDFNEFNPGSYSDAIAAAAKAEGAQVVVVSTTANNKYLAPMLAVKMQAGYVPNATALPDLSNGFSVKHSVFTNKAYAYTAINTDVKLIGLAKNAYGLKESAADASVEAFSAETTKSGTSVTATDKATDKVTIADAEVVVSGGRGLKGPENWGLIEDLAETLGAATACSKPVSDMGWRPHSEHVGQTGKPVASNLYIAIGISGAIQHLAGVNASKVKVVINNDPEAPFFKAAEYGIVGDAFEVVPELTQKLKAFKAQNA